MTLVDVVRAAVPADAPALSLVHAETWADTYVGRVPDALASERIERARHRDWVAHGEARGRVGGGVLVLVRDEEVVGFCEHGPTEDADDDAGSVGHIMRLYVHPASQRRGGGASLLEAACERLAGAGLVSATLWTPEAPWNRAHSFYARLGWRRQDVLSSGDPPDVRYRRALP